MNKKNNRKGFTTVELVIVIAVIAILATVLIPTFSNLIGKANDSAALQDAQSAYNIYTTDFDYMSGGVPAANVILVVKADDTDGQYLIVVNGNISSTVYKTQALAKAAIDTATGKTCTVADSATKTINGIAIYVVTVPNT